MSLSKARRSKPKRKVKSRHPLFLLTFGLMIVFVAYLCVPSHVIPTEKLSLKAAVLDQLAVQYPNRAFIEATESIMRQVGLEVDIYENVTVDLYRTLPRRGYGLIVFRESTSPLWMQPQLQAEARLGYWSIIQRRPRMP